VKEEFKMQSYDVVWNARGMDFNYNGSERVMAADKDSAKTKARTIVSRKLVMARQLIEVVSVKTV
jgi:hypothetical protein